MGEPAEDFGLERIASGSPGSVCLVEGWEHDKGVYLNGSLIYEGAALTALNSANLSGHKWVKEIDIRAPEDAAALLAEYGSSISRLVIQALRLVKQHQQQTPYHDDVHLGMILRDYGNHAYADIGWRNGSYVFVGVKLETNGLTPGEVVEISRDRIMEYHWASEADCIATGEYPVKACEFFLEHPLFK